MSDKLRTILLILIVVGIVSLVIIKIRNKSIEHFKISRTDNLPSKALFKMMDHAMEANDNFQNDIIATAQFEVDEAQTLFNNAKKNFENAKDVLSRAGYELNLRKDNLNYIKETFTDKAYKDSQNKPEYTSLTDVQVKWGELKGQEEGEPGMELGKKE